MLCPVSNCAGRFSVWGLTVKSGSPWILQTYNLHSATQLLIEFNLHEITQGPPTKWFITECYYSTHLLFQCKYWLQSRQSANYVIVILNKILHCTLKSQFEGTCKMISLGASDANKVSVLYTYLLSWGPGWVGIWLEVCVS